MHEIEHKFLLAKPASQILATLAEAGIQPRRLEIEQRYVTNAGDWSVRLRRTMEAGLPPQHHLTLKRGLTKMRCVEIETLVDPEFHEHMLTQCGPTVVKIRHIIPWLGHFWELDVFQNPELQGLETVEIELTHEDEAFAMPDWVGKDVTGVKAYKNASIARSLKCMETAATLSILRRKNAAQSKRKKSKGAPVRKRA